MTWVTLDRNPLGAPVQISRTVVQRIRNGVAGRAKGNAREAAPCGKCTDTWGRVTLQSWADRFGYDLDLRTELLDPCRPPAWSKVVLLRQRLKTHRIALWVDADAIVVDGSTDLSLEVTSRRPIAMVAHEYSGQRVPNTGVIALRSCATTRTLLDRLWNMTEYIHHPWWENAALLDLLGYDIRREPIAKVRASPLDDRIVWLDKAWNSIDLDPAAHPFVKHYPGMPFERRLAGMRSDLATVSPAQADDHR